MNDYYKNMEVEKCEEKYADKQPRHFPLLPGLLALSAALHLSAVMIWPLNTALPTVGVKQLVLEIQRLDPPGMPSTPPIRPQVKNTQSPVARTPAKTITQPSETARVKPLLSGLPGKTVDSATRDIQQPRKLSRDQIEEKLHGHIQQALLPHFSYPAIARRRGWEGTVRISLRVENDGRLTNLQVIESCKFTALNRAALHSLRQVSGIPAAKQWLTGHYMDMVLPIQYLLLDS